MILNLSILQYQMINQEPSLNNVSQSTQPNNQTEVKGQMFRMDILFPFELTFSDYLRRIFQCLIFGISDPVIRVSVILYLNRNLTDIFMFQINLLEF